MTAQQQVAITGMGIVSAAGMSLESFWTTLLAARTGIAPITCVDTDGLNFTRGAQVRDFCAEDALQARDAAQLDRFAQFALLAAGDAVRDCGLEPAAFASHRCGVILGSSLGGLGTLDEAYKALYRDGSPRTHPMNIPKIMPNSATSRIAMEYGVTGPSFTLSTACSSSNHAIGHAFWLIRAGVLDRAIVGGSEAPFNTGNLVAWNALRVVSPDTCRPFCESRTGMTLGEGAGIMVLESMAAARARDAGIYAEISGFGMSSDAHHLVIPSHAGAEQAVRAALADGAIAAEEVGYINAHGTGTMVNDQMEADVINAVFQDHAQNVAVSSTKGAHGHGLGAAGALEAVATALALSKRQLPPTAGLETPDAECNLDIVAHQARPRDAHVALSNSFAFGGLNAVLAMRAAT